MTIFTRSQLDSLVHKIRHNEIANVYLLFGERFLCQQAAEKINDALLTQGGNTYHIDGNLDNLSSFLGKISSFSLFQGRQVYWITDTKLFHSTKVAKSLWSRALKATQENNRQQAGRYLNAMLETAGLDSSDQHTDLNDFTPAQWKKTFGFNKPREDLSWTEEVLLAIASVGKKVSETSATDPAALFEQTLQSGIPSQNILILTTEDVDKRKRLFKFLKDQFVVVDLSVESGSSNRARKDQKSVLQETLRQTLAEFNKTMAPEVADLLFERVGFHPVAVVMEAEKLALYTGTRNQIKRNDLDELVGRTRQEALFELTDALGKQNLGQALMVAGRLQDNGIHPLAIIATIRNYLRALLLFRALQLQPEYGYTQGMSPRQFQQQCLPRLKQNEQWKKELSGHPYAVYMQFKMASAFQLIRLKKWMKLVLQADFRLKGSPIANDTVIQHLIISMLGNNMNAVLQKHDKALHY